MTFPIRRIWLFLMAGSLCGCNVSEVYRGTGKRIIIEMRLSDEIANQRPANYVLKDNLTLAFRAIVRVENSPAYHSVEAKANGRKVRWELYSNEAIEMNYGFGKLNIVSPGDSICVRYNNEDIYFTGRGAEKLTIWNTMQEEAKRIGVPTKNSNTIHSISDYLKWNDYLDQKLAILMPILDTNKTKLQAFEYEYLRSLFVGMIENDRIDAFQALRNSCKKDSTYRQLTSNLSAIWDSTQYKYWSKWFRSLPEYYGSIYTLYRFDQMEILRQLNFDSNNDSLKSKSFMPNMLYKSANQKYSGQMREKLLTLILDEAFLDRLGYNSSITKAALKDYYSQPGFPEYKQKIKELEDRAKKLAKS